VKRKIFTYTSSYPFSAQELFLWHMRKDALKRLLPPWQKVKVLSAGSPKNMGSLTKIRMYIGPLFRDWVSKHVLYEEGKRFVDEAIKSPMLFWRHSHEFIQKQKEAILTDHIEYALPWYVGSSYVEKNLQKLFAFRHRRLSSDLAIFHKYDMQKKKILLSGASGLVGAEFMAFLQALGHDVYCLKRGKTDMQRQIIGWNPEQDGNHIDAFEGFDAIVHLSGENIAKKRWSKAQKERIFQSRCRDTYHLATIVSRLSRPPKVLISASAVGIYGDRKEEVLAEDQTFGNDFLANVCIHWEKAVEPLKQKAIRLCQARFGYILTPQGGMLGEMLLPFRVGAGGIMGSGRQMIPWVALDDVIYALYHLMMTETLSGPINIVASHPVTQKEFAQTLAKVLMRPCFLRIPRFFLKVMLGERADALIFRSANVSNAKLLQSGYQPHFQTLETYFKEYL
jgi:hypothetical protein